MGFVEAVRTCLKLKFAIFQGRASRSEYWYFFLFYFLVVMGLALVGTLFVALLGGISGDPTANPAVFIAFVPAGLAVLGLIVPIIAVSVRRLHDRNMSGWWYLGFMVLSQIPLVGVLISLGFLVLTCLKGTEGPNRFGRDPLGPQHNADVFA